MATSLEILNITGFDAVELGRGAAATEAGAIAIGATVGSPTEGEVLDGAFATAANAYAIGAGSKATAAGAVQIGAGTNATANSLQFQATRIPTATQYNAMRTFLNQALLDIGTLLISATPEEFKTTTTAVFNIDGVQRSKTAEDNLAFSAADTINVGADAGEHYGAWLVQVDAAGAVSTKPAGGLDDQVYATGAAAIAALPEADASNVAFGHIVVHATTGAAWTANTDDMTDGSDCTTATFTDAYPATLPAAI